MLQNVINSIIDAENEAENIVKEATVSAKDNYTKAKEDSDKLVKENAKQVKVEYRQIVADAQEVANKEYDKIIEKGNQDAKALLDSSGEQINDAAKFIAGRLLEKYGNSWYEEMFHSWLWAR